MNGVQKAPIVCFFPPKMTLMMQSSEYQELFPSNRADCEEMIVLNVSPSLSLQPVLVPLSWTPALNLCLLSEMFLL